jgi:hypothetical protein
MEVGLPFVGLVRDAGGFQVGSNGLGGLMVQRKDGTPSGYVAEPVAKFARQGNRDRLVGGLAVLGAASTEKHARLGATEAERFRRQASQLGNPKASQGGRLVGDRSQLPAHLKQLGASQCGLDESGQLIIGQGSAGVGRVLLGE